MEFSGGGEEIVTLSDAKDPSRMDEENNYGSVLVGLLSINRLSLRRAALFHPRFSYCLCVDKADRVTVSAIALDVGKWRWEFYGYF